MKRIESKDFKAPSSEDLHNQTEVHAPTHVELKDIVLKKFTSEEPRINHTEQEPSDSQPSSFYYRRERIPRHLKNSFRGSANGRKPTLKKSKVSQYWKDKVFQEKFVCEICECEYKCSQKVFICNCNHFYCDSCAQSYAIYKVNMFEEVICPNQDCFLTINLNGGFYKNLPQNIQSKYVKLHAFYIASKDPNLRLCPNEKCQAGILRIVDGIPPQCESCGKVFCPKCLFPQHDGQCEKNQVQFFETNLHYRQCKKCKNVIEKSQGCNHMTCRCGHQFCYICGKDWNSNGHLCNETQALPNQPDNCFQCCFCLNDCGCVGQLFKLIVKLILGIPLFILFASILIIKYTVLFTLFLGISILVGAVGYTCEIICDQDSCCLSFILFIFLPISILGGIGLGIKEILCDIMSQVCEEQVNICQVFQSVFCW